MTDTLTQDDLDQALTRQSEDFQRQLQTQLASFRNPAPTGPRYTSFGAYLKTLASGDQAAAEFYKTLALDGGTTDDAAAPDRPTWISDAIRLIQARRRVIGAFTRQTLPAEGMSMEYLKLGTNTVAVGKQAAEGDNLPKGKITLVSDNVPIETYGGATTVSRQVIDRASVPYLNTLGQAMDIEYARQTEAAARDALAALFTSRESAAIPVTSLDFDGVTDALVDAAVLFDDSAYTLDAVYASTDVFKKLKNIKTESGDPLMTVQGQGVNQVGTINVPGLTGSIAGVRVWLLPTADAGTLAAYDPIALTVWESASAPFQLQADNILNLSRDFSKYGYLAAASQYPDALVPLTLPAA